MPSRQTIQRIALVAAGAVLVTAGAAEAAGRIGPNQIRNNAIHARHIANGAVTNPKLRNGAVNTAKIRVGAVRTHRIANQAVTSAKIRNGTIRPADLSAAVRQQLMTTFAGPNWGIVDRSVVGNGDSYLRAGPSAAAGGQSTKPPYGIGSLGMRVGASTDKATFGDQVDFAGMPVSGITTLSYWVFRGGSSVVTPNLQFEINPNLASSPATFTTLSFENPTVPANVWTKVDPTTGPAGWGMTGVAGTATGCQPTPVTARCTWDQIQTALASDNNGTPAAISFAVQFNMGTGAAQSSSAVDGLQINNQVFDFEPFGVSKVAPH